MLVLSRKVGEKIYIGKAPNLVVVEVLEIRRGYMRIGITAPRDVKVDREEVYDQIQRELAAARGNPSPQAPQP